MVINQGANYAGGAVNLLKRQSAKLEKEDNPGLAAAVRPAGLGLGGWQAQKRAKTAARVLHGYGAGEGDINLPWAKREGKPVVVKDEASWDGRSVITNDEGEKEDPMAVLRRFNAERVKIQASPLRRRIDQINPGSTAEVRKALLAQKDLAGTRLPPIFAPLPPKPPRPKTPPFDPERFNLRSKSGPADLRSAFRQQDRHAHRHHGGGAGRERQGPGDEKEGTGVKSREREREGDEFAFEPGARGAIEGGREGGGQVEAGEGVGERVEWDPVAEAAEAAEVAKPVAAEQAGDGALAGTRQLPRTEGDPISDRNGQLASEQHGSMLAQSQSVERASARSVTTEAKQKPKPRPAPAPVPVAPLFDDDDDPFATALTAPPAPAPAPGPAPGPSPPPGQDVLELDLSAPAGRLSTVLEVEEDAEAVQEAEAELSSSRTLPLPKRRRPVNRQAKPATSFGPLDELGMFQAMQEGDQAARADGDDWPVFERSLTGGAGEAVWMVADEVVVLRGGEEGQLWADVQQGEGDAGEAVTQHEGADHPEAVATEPDPYPELLDMPEITLEQLAEDNPTSALSTYDWMPTSYDSDPVVEREAQASSDGAAEATARRPLFAPELSEDESDPIEVDSAGKVRDAGWGGTGCV